MDEVELGYQIAPEARHIPTPDDMWAGWYRCAELIGQRAALGVVLDYLSPMAQMDVLEGLLDAATDAIPWEEPEPDALEARRRIADARRRLDNFAGVV